MADRRLREHIQKTVAEPAKRSVKQGVGITPHAHLHRGPEEAFQPGWKVEGAPGVASGSFTDKHNREVAVPLGPSREEEIVRLHEAEHLTATDLEATRRKLSRSRVSIGERELRLAEEIRVNGRLTCKGHVGVREWRQVAEANEEEIPDTMGIIDAARKARTITEADKVVEATLARARLGLQWSTSGQSLLPNWLRAVAQTADQLFRRPDDYDVMRALARNIRMAEGRRQAEQKREQVAQQMRENVGDRLAERVKRRMINKVQPHTEKGLKQELGRLDTLQKLLNGQKPDPAAGGEGGPNWGRMDIIRLPMPIRTTRPGEGRKWRITDDPSHRLTRPHRMVKWGDRLAFKRRPKKGGTGAFLVDVSGSMQWDLSDLQALLDAMPRANIALYSGAYDRGTLLILAQGGQRATEEEMRSHQSSMGGANVVDGPALEWLAKQPEPRVWVSDGFATEVGDGCTERAMAAAAGICRKNRIRRIDKDDLIPNREDD